MSGSNGPARRAGAVGWCLLLSAAWWVLDQISTWLDPDSALPPDPAIRTAVWVTVVARLLVAYLATAVVANQVAAASGRAGWLRLARRLTLPPLRPLIDLMAVSSVLIGVTSVPYAVGAAGDEPPSGPDSPSPSQPAESAPGPAGGVDGSVMRRLPTDDRVAPTTPPPATTTTAPSPVRPPDVSPPATEPTSDPPSPAPTSAPPVLHWLDDPPPPGTIPPDNTEPESPTVDAPTERGPTPAPAPLPGPPALPDAPAGALETWTIAPGDHLWHVATETLIDRGNPAPSAGEVLDYLLQLIAMNESVLVNPGDPDLVLPGQVFTLPGAAEALRY